MSKSKELIKCNICGEKLEHKEYWAKEHLKKRVKLTEPIFFDFLLLCRLV